MIDVYVVDREGKREQVAGNVPRMDLAITFAITSGKYNDYPNAVMYDIVRQKRYGE